MLLGPNVSRGLNRRGMSVTADLNPDPKAIVAQGVLQEVKATAFDGTNTRYGDPVVVFREDETSFHKDEAVRERPQHLITGLDPQSDPDSVFDPKESFGDRDDPQGPAAQKTNPTGLDPQDDPAGVFSPDETVAPVGDDGPGGQRHEPTGLSPQTDPDQVFAPAESTGTQDEAGAGESPQHEHTGLDPQPDPDDLFDDK